jgi:hypothetical protein
MPVFRYRSIEDMPPPWRSASDPGNLKRIAEMMTLYRRFAPRLEPGVRKYRTMEEANADRNDPYRQSQPED